MYNNTLGRKRKVRNFLSQMGAVSKWNPVHKRKFRKIKRMALKGHPNPKNANVYNEIYNHFRLNLYTSDGNYWKDLRPLLYEDCEEYPYRKRKQVTLEEYAQIRRWSLNGPIKVKHEGR